MTPEKLKMLHKIWGIVTAVLIGIVAICLIVSCISIYRSGEKPFNAEVVAAGLNRIAIPGWLCLVFVAGGIVLHWFAPVNEGRAKTKRDKIVKPKAIDKQRLCFVRGGILVAAVALIVLGIVNEGYADVLGKAIRICQECIGIG